MTIDRRTFLAGGLAAVTSAVSATRAHAEAADASSSALHVDPAAGADANAGTKGSPLKSLAEAARRVNQSKAAGPNEIVLSPGLHLLEHTAQFKNDRPYTKTDRLVIRAATLPDDPGWAPDQMPMIVPAVPLVSTWFGGKPDDYGAHSYGMQIEVSHVTVQGLKFYGQPVYEYAGEKKVRRCYPIMREGMDLEDLLVTQCLFVGDPHTMPNHVALIANGHGLVVDHCVFFKCKVPIVFWNATGGVSHGNALRYSLLHGAYACGVWTTQTGDDFEFHHNVISNSMYAWIREYDSKTHYRAEHSLFAGNQMMAGFGDGPLLNFKTTPHDFLKMGPGALLNDRPVQVDLDQSKRDYLHVRRGTLGSAIGAGLFTKRIEG